MKDFIEKMKKSNQLIMGIGHRIKSLANPDQRVVLIKDSGARGRPRELTDEVPRTARAVWRGVGMCLRGHVLSVSGGQICLLAIEAATEGVVKRVGQLGRRPS